LQTCQVLYKSARIVFLAFQKCTLSVEFLQAGTGWFIVPTSFEMLLTLLTAC